MATGNKLNYLIETKNEIRNAIIEKGQEVTENDTFRSYADKVRAIQTGGGEDKSIEIINGTISEYIDNAGQIPTIGAYAFYSKSNLTKISFPECTTIGAYAFYHCSKLSEYSFPKCTQIGGYTFYSCIGLKSLNFPDCRVLGDRAFKACSNVSEIYFPNVSKVSDDAFAGCKNLTEISLPQCYTIGASCFQSCSNLVSINIPKLTATGFGLTSCFDSCYKLSNINDIYASCSTTSYMFRQCSALKSIAINTNNIGYSTFDRCISLESVYILTVSSKISLSANAFSSTPIINSSYLGYYGSVYVPSKALNYIQSATNWVSLSSRLAPIPNDSYLNEKYVFAYEYRSDSTLTEVPVEKRNAQYILNYAFGNCLSLISASFPNCKAILDGAFWSCTSLKEGYFPECEVIHGNVFASCYSLEKLYLPKCEALLDDYTFYSCSSLKELHIPVCSVFTSRFYFSDCRKLSILNLGQTSVVCKLQSGYIDLDVYTPMKYSSYLGYYGSIYVPDSMVDLYKSATGWVKFSDRITGVSNLPQS
jgi:hypothetical protein